MKAAIIPLVVFCLAQTSPAASVTWPGFRGQGDSHSDAKNLPTSWSDTENVAWRITLPGYGQSSPVIWNDRVYVTSTEGANKETMHGHAVNLKDGSLAWTRTFEATQKVPNGDMVSRAAPTPAVDGDRVYFFFESGDLVALGHDGKQLWKRSLVDEYGEFLGGHGIGCSPALTPESLVILVDHQGPGYLLNIDKKTGKDLWKTHRSERGSWSSPIYDARRGRGEILINSNGLAESFALENGSRLWFVENLSGNTVSSPSATRDLVVAASSNPQSTVAIDRGSSGDITGTGVLWTAEGVTSSFCSPLIHNDRVYTVNDAGVAHANDLVTGELKWEARVAGSCWASPIAAGNVLYFFAKSGWTTVLKIEDDEKPAHLGNNQLTIDGAVVYGVAFVDGNIVVRTGAELICIRSM